MARDVERQVRSSATKRKTSGSSKNRSLTTLKDCAVLFSLIQQMRSSRKPWKTLREESWKIRCQQKRIARSGEESAKKLVAILMLPRPNTKHARIVEADESTRKPLEGTLHKNHERPLCRKRNDSLNHYNLVHKFISMLQAMKILDATAQSKTNGTNS